MVLSPANDDCERCTNHEESTNVHVIVGHLLEQLDNTGKICWRLRCELIGLQQRDNVDAAEVARLCRAHETELRTLSESLSATPTLTYAGVDRDTTESVSNLFEAAAAEDARQSSESIFAKPLEDDVTTTVCLSGLEAGGTSQASSTGPPSYPATLKNDARSDNDHLLLQSAPNLVTLQDYSDMEKVVGDLVAQMFATARERSGTLRGGPASFIHMPPTDQQEEPSKQGTVHISIQFPEDGSDGVSSASLPNSDDYVLVKDS